MTNPPSSTRRSGRRRYAVLALITLLAIVPRLVGGSPKATADAATAAANSAERTAPATAVSRAGVADGTFLRGMTVSCPGMGRIWGSPAMSEALAELKRMGVEWVAIHPYAGVRRDGSIRYQNAAEATYLAAAVDRARAAGIELFWKPHLAYWGSFEWRGAIDFGDDEAAWRRFFDQYRAFIVDQARFAAGAGVRLFAVGVELEGTTGREAEWRRIIAAVRAVFPGTVTYAANWDRLEDVPFWDAVDWIGVQAYFPLSAADAPSRDELIAGWQPHLRALRALSSRHGEQPILFAEIGYDLSPHAAREPWRADSHNDAASRALRRSLIELALEQFAGQPPIRGMFWWKWMPGSGHYHDANDRDFSMRHDDARQLLHQAWGRSTAAGR